MISILTDIQKKANKILLFTTLVGTMTACDSVFDFDEGDCSIEYGVTFKYDYNIKKCGRVRSRGEKHNALCF